MTDHRSCSREEGCLILSPSECPAAKAAKRRADVASAAWHRLVLRAEDGSDVRSDELDPIPTGGWRHFLIGQPIHCGETLWLQANTFRSDDYGEYTVPSEEHTPVRYELDGRRRVILYAEIGGHLFSMPLDGGHRFHWPEHR